MGRGISAGDGSRRGPTGGTGLGPGAGGLRLGRRLRAGDWGEAGLGGGAGEDCR